MVRLLCVQLVVVLSCARTPTATVTAHAGGRVRVRVRVPASGSAAVVAPAAVKHFTLLAGHDTPHAATFGKALFRGRPTTNVDEIKIVCLYTAGCTGFSSAGWLKNGSATTLPTPDPATDLYTLAAGPPQHYHYLVLSKADADHEDLRRAPKGASLADMAALCSNDTKCAGFNSDGWLKSTVASEPHLIYINSNSLFKNGAKWCQTSRGCWVPNTSRIQN